MVKLENNNDTQALEDASAAVLIEESIKNNESYLALGGALCSAESDPTTEKYTRFIVDEGSCSDAIYWNEFNKACTSDFFNTLWEKVEDHIIHKNHYINHFEVGENADTYTPFECITESAFHSLFLGQYYFTPEENNSKKKALWSVLHAANYLPDEDTLKQDSYSIAICFAQRKIIIAGLHSSEAIKHTLYSVQSFLLMEKGILSLHAGLAQTRENKNLLIIGSNQSKLNTLLHASDFQVISDNHVFWQKKKVTRAAQGLQLIDDDVCTNRKYKSTSRYFCSLLENQYHDPISRQCVVKPQSDKRSKVRWTIPNAQYYETCEQLDALLILVHDAQGVLPPVAILDNDAAEQYFMCGYNSERLPREEHASSKIIESFSPAHQNHSSFRSPTDDIQLFKKHLKHLGCPIYLINSFYFAQNTEPKQNDSEASSFPFDSNFIEIILSLPGLADPSLQFNQHLKYYTPAHAPAHWFQRKPDESCASTELTQQLGRRISEVYQNLLESTDVPTDENTDN